MPKPMKPFQREVCGSRNLRALILAEGATTAECHVQDVSRHGAKIVVEMPSAVPNQFELAFSATSNKRRCEVVWRRKNRWVSSSPDDTLLQVPYLLGEPLPDRRRPVKAASCEAGARNAPALRGWRRSGPLAASR
jgi:hypothetical protein